MITLYILLIIVLIIQLTIQLIVFYDRNYIISRRFNQNNKMVNCLIKDISSFVDGGAISINSSDSLHLNDSIFYQSIYIDGYGGAIYFLYGLHITIFTIFAWHFVNICGQFACIGTNNNQIFDKISIYNFGNLIGDLTHLIAFGDQNITNINISNNNIHVDDIKYLYPNIMFSNY